MIIIKKISIIAYKNNTTKVYEKLLNDLFKGYVIIESYSIEDQNITNVVSDIIIASTYLIYDFVKKHVKNCNNIVIADITLKKDSLNKLMHLPEGTKALLVNSSLEMSVETIGTIYNSGIKHLDLYPVYPNIEEIPNYNIAITPGEVELVPENIEEIIDLGDRVLSMKTIVNIAVKLNLSHLIQTNKFKNYFLSLVKSDLGFENLFSQVDILESKLDLILKIFDDGVIVLGNDRKINFINEAAKKLLNIENMDLLDSSIEKLFYEFTDETNEKQDNVIKDKVILISEQYFVVSIYPITNLFNDLGYVLLLSRFTDTEKEQNKIRNQIISKGHVARYKFKDIIGNSSTIYKVKEKALKIAASDSSVLICGKSGTGKELFAQSIHNASNRKNNPFIAINCASIPESLLESELFGYDAGAFTGAKKGGKLGYFELAHMGTLFLDEISEMDFNLQARLLRVLQEKEVVRIGGDTVVNVDVRVISATNKNLEELVSQNKFREDLYYRINVLRVDIPELSKRKDDIPLLIEIFKKQNNAHFTITNEGLRAILDYKWIGNIRELKNFVERLKCLGKEIIDINDVYECLDMDYNDETKYFYNNEEKIKIERFFNINKNLINRYNSVLSVLAQNYNSKNKLGRRTISEILASNKIYMSEQEVRTILNELKLNDMIEVYKGRGGTSITGVGLRALNYIKDIYAEYS